MKKLYKTGDKIVEGGEVFRIFKIEDIKIEGKKQRLIHYKPFFPKSDSPDAVYSIPEKSIKETSIRRPLSKKELKEILDELKKKGKPAVALDINDAKEVLKECEINNIVALIKTLWVEKKAGEDSFTKSRSNVFEAAVDTLYQEFAFVNNITLEKASDKIYAALKASGK